MSPHLSRPPIAHNANARNQSLTPLVRACVGEQPSGRSGASGGGVDRAATCPLGRRNRFLRMEGGNVSKHDAAKPEPWDGSPRKQNSTAWWTLRRHVVGCPSSYRMADRLRSGISLPPFRPNQFPVQADRSASSIRSATRDIPETRLAPLG